MKKLKASKLAYLMCSLVLVAFFIACPIFLNSKINNNINLNQTATIDGGFLKVWNIDDFEGGSGNRTAFLEKIAKQFEAKHKGFYVIVQSLTSEEAFNSITSGNAPDLISFSHYSGAMLSDVLVDYQGAICVRDDLLEYGKLNGKIKAIPWYLSGYCLIGNSAVNYEVLDNLNPETMFSFGVQAKSNYKPSIAVGLANNNLAFLSALINSAQVGTVKDIVKDYDKLSTFEAYNDFTTKNSASVLLGTARDFYRVQNKVDLGVMSECEFVPLGGFSDLIGYIGICSNLKEDYVMANEFIEFLTSDVTQLQLSSIGLFSSTYTQIYKDNQKYSAFEKVLQRTIKSINIFNSKSQKEKLWTNSINAILGDKDSLKYIKNYLK